MTLLATLWDGLAVGGGWAALLGVIALAVGIALMTLFFLGSAVVALQGFARSARRPGPIAGAVVVWGVLLGLLVLGQDDLRESLPPDLGAAGIALSFAGVVAMVGVTTGLTFLLLRAVPAARLQRAGLLLLGGATALLVAGTGQTGIGFFGLLCVVVALVALAGLRRIGRIETAGGGVSGTLGVLAGVLAAGLAATWLVEAPRPPIAALGGVGINLLLAVILLGLLPLAAAGLLEARRTAEWFIAVRYLFAKRRQTFISVITAICIGGVAAGVWLIITVLSVMNGFQEVWREEIVGKRAHLTVQSGLGPFPDYEEALRAVLEEPEVVGAAPFLDAEGMVRGETGRIVGVRVRGVDPDRVGSVTTLADEVVAGSLEDLARRAPAGENGDGEPVPGIAVGSQLAASLGLRVGEPLIVVSPFGGPPTPFGPAPRLHRFRLSAVFQSSFLQFDEVYTYVDLAAAQEFLRVGDVVHGIEVRVEDFYRSRRVADAIQERLGFPYYARDWKEFFPAFFQALKTEQVMMFVLLTMIMVVAAFVIVATLIMMIMEKTSDIAILKAMGAEDGAVERIFAIEGALIGIAGTVVGVVAGIGVTTQLPWVQRQVEVLFQIDTLPASVYQFSTLPWEIEPLQVFGVAAIAMVLALGATVLPSRQGAGLDPAEALRYE